MKTVPKGSFFSGSDAHIFSYGDTVSVEGTTLSETPLCFDLLRIDGDVYALSAGRVKEIGEDVLQYMISCAVATVDEYNDMFQALDKGYLSLEAFINKVNE